MSEMSRVLVVGNPNAGKSTLFNGLSGGGARVGNFAGTTVELREGRANLAGLPVTFVDVPGTFSLAARSPEERVAIDAVLGIGGERPSALLVVLDAPRLSRSLYLVLQLLELKVPLVVGLNLMDEARALGCAPDASQLEDMLQVPVIPTVGRSGEGLSDLSDALKRVLTRQDPACPGSPHGWSEDIAADARTVEAMLPEQMQAWASESSGRAGALARWLLLSLDDDPPPHLAQPMRERLIEVREAAVAEGRDLQAELVESPYRWIDANLPSLGGVATESVFTTQVDRILLHPLAGTLIFIGVMSTVFAALFSWADPMIGAIEWTVGWLGSRVDGFFASAAQSTGSEWVALAGQFVTEGLIGGVGAVVVFVPQIALLFLFLALMEDCGYLARAAHLMDRILRAAGLPGQAFVPLLSGYACAVPAIMATRTMPRFRDRLLTMMVVPLTSCSARLPVYTLMIGALFPPTVAGLAIPLRPVALMALYLFSTVMTLLAAVVIGRLILPETATPAVLELPPYRVPDPKVVARLVFSRCMDFLREAGGIILQATVILWLLLTFPRYEPVDLLPPETLASLSETEAEEMARPLALERSFAGRIGHAIEPVIEPLGYDWQIGIGLIGAVAAREVFVSTMGMVHGVGSDVDEETPALRERIAHAKRPDGSPVYTPLVGASLLVFFALAMQCLSTVAVLRKETGSWRWPTFVMVGMTGLAWVCALLVFQGGRLLGFT